MAYCEPHHWWFGFSHFVADPADHPMVGKLGPHALDLSLDEFRALLSGRRGAIRTFLLDQARVAGIGNVHVQTPLWRAKIHPLRPIPTLTDAEVAALLQALREALQGSAATQHGGDRDPNAPGGVVYPCLSNRPRQG